MKGTTGNGPSFCCREAPPLLTLMVMATLLLLSSLGCGTPQPDAGSPGGQSQAGAPCPNCTPATLSTGGQQTAASPTPAKPVLGKAEAQDPDPAKLVQTDKWGEVPANQVGVLLKDGLTRKDAEKVAAALDGSIVAEVEFIQLYAVQTKGSTEADLKAALDKAGKMAEVDMAFPNTQFFSKEIKGTACSLLRDPAYQQGKNGLAYDMIGLEQAWKYIRASGIPLNDVHVGILDSGLYSSSEEIKGKAKISGLGKEDVIDQPAKDNKGKLVNGGLNHGTEVTHIIAADPDNGGATGIAGPLGSKLTVTMSNRRAGPNEYTETKADPKDPTKLSFSDGKGYLVKSFAQMVQQIEAGATVINWSQGPKEPSPDNEWKAGIYRKFLETMYKKYPRVVFVAAAGNEAGGLNGKNYDIGGLKLPNVITVGALGEDGHTASFSNFAQGDGEVTIAADGTNVFMGYGADGKPVNGSGTSFSTPQVTATVAVLQSINPNLTAQDIKKILVESGGRGVSVDNKPVPVAENLGGRVLRVDEAVLRVINDVRKAKGLAPLTKELLDKLGTIDASADVKSPKEFTIRTSLGAVGEKPADVKIEVMGEGMLSGNSTKQLSTPGELTWGLTLLDEKKGPTVKLTRLDTGACATIDLNPVDIAGLWTGSWTLTDAKVYGDITIPDPFDEKKPPTVIKKEECESQIKASKGKPIKSTMEFTPTSPDAGTVVMATIDEKGKETKEKPWPYRVSGSSVVIEMQDKGGKLKMEGQVSQEGKENLLKGNLQITMDNNGAKMLDITGVFSMSKPAQ